MKINVLKYFPKYFLHRYYKYSTKAQDKSTQEGCDCQVRKTPKLFNTKIKDNCMKPLEHIWTYSEKGILARFDPSTPVQRQPELRRETCLKSITIKLGVVVQAFDPSTRRAKNKQKSIIILFFKTVFLCSSGCPVLCSVDQALLKLTEIHLSLPSGVLELKVHVTTWGSKQIIFFTVILMKVVLS